MSLPRTALVALMLGIVPGSCIAAPVASTPANSPAAATPVKAARPTSLTPAPGVIGIFRLDRAPVQGGYALGWVPPGTVRLVIDGHDVRFAADRRFSIGFGRDFQAYATITAFRADGSAVTDKIAVAPRQWRMSTTHFSARFARLPWPTARMSA